MGLLRPYFEPAYGEAKEIKDLEMAKEPPAGQLCT
ncbi:uncharacterized protein METZ01_LOCUS306643, partial [marine metagenome]